MEAKADLSGFKENGNDNNRKILQRLYKKM
jgi:hypothetical protein